jgi:hypothetical protein
MKKHQSRPKTKAVSRTRLKHRSAQCYRAFLRSALKWMPFVKLLLDLIFTTYFG